MELTDGLTTEMSFAIYGSKSEFGPESARRELTPTALKPRYEARAIYELFKGVGIKILPVVADDLRVVADDPAFRAIDELPEKVDVLILTLPNSPCQKSKDSRRSRRLQLPALGAYGFSRPPIHRPRWKPAGTKALRPFGAVLYAIGPLAAGRASSALASTWA